MFSCHPEVLAISPGDWEPIGHDAPLKPIELNPKWPDNPPVPRSVGELLADAGRKTEAARIWRLVQEAAGGTVEAVREPEPPNLADHHAEAFFLTTDHVFWVSSPQHVEWSVVGDWADWSAECCYRAGAEALLAQGLLQQHAQPAPLGGLNQSDLPPARPTPPNAPAAVSGPARTYPINTTNGELKC